MYLTMCCVRAIYYVKRAIYYVKRAIYYVKRAMYFVYKAIYFTMCCVRRSHTITSEEISFAIYHVKKAMCSV